MNTVVKTMDYQHGLVMWCPTKNAIVWSFRTVLGRIISISWSTWMGVRCDETSEARRLLG